MLLMIDNYDSFTWNLIQMLGKYEPDIRCVRNDEKLVAELLAMQPDGLILSPGPGRPEDAGDLLAIIEAFKGKIPILGICLGHQALCQVYGAKIGYAKTLMHGKRSEIAFDDKSPLFQTIQKPCLVGRYHSLAADKASLPDSLAVTAKTQDGEIMAVSDEASQVYGLQFHPESILTDQGEAMLEAFVALVNQQSQQPARSSL